MPVQCIICRKGQGPECSFFRIPKNNRRQKTWIRLVKKSTGYAVKPKFDRICDLHFRAEDIDWSGIRPKLFPDTVPIIEKRFVMEDNTVIPDQTDNRYYLSQDRRNMPSWCSFWEAPQYRGSPERDIKENESVEANHSGQHDKAEEKEMPITQSISSGGKKRRSREHDVSMDNISSAVKTTKKSTTTVDNEFEIFGQSVTSQLNAMPLILALQAQQHIQNYLSQLRIQHITSREWPPSLRNSTTRDTTSPALSYYEDYQSPSPSWAQIPATRSENDFDVPSSRLLVSEALTSTVSEVKSEFEYE